MRAVRKSYISFLREHPLGVLATVNKDGYPELASVYCRVGDDLSLSFITKIQTRKLKNVLKKEHVALMVTNEETLTTVEITGKAYIVEDTMEFAQIYDAFHTLFTLRPGKKWLPPISQIRAGKYIACKIIPERICYRTFSIRKQGGTEPVENILRPRTL